MKPPSVPRSPRVAIRPHLIVAGACAAISLALLLLMLYAAPTLAAFGLTGNLWYVLLLALGLCVAVLVFSLFRSWASYSGNVLSGKVEIGGPAVVMLLVVILGFWLPPPTAALDLTVFLQTEGAPTNAFASSGRVTLDLGADRRTESVGDKGEVRFMGVPPNLRGSTVPVALESDKLELTHPKARIALNGQPQYLQVRAKKLRFEGNLFDERNQPVPNARVVLAGQTATTDADGRFEMPVPADLPEADKVAAISAEGFEPQRVTVEPGGNRMQLKLARK